MSRFLAFTFAVLAALPFARADEPIAAGTAPAAAPAETAAPATPAPAVADPNALEFRDFGAWDSALTMPAGRVQVGVFAPLRWGITNDVELEIHPILAFVAPSPLIRVTHLRTKDLVLTGEYGLSYPSFLFGQADGFLFPTKAALGGDAGQHLVPRAGLAATFGVGEKALATARADLAFGLPLAAGNARSMDSFIAPFELLMAPVFRTFRAHLGFNYDRPLNDFLRLRTTLDGYLVGGQPEGYAQSSPLFVSAHVGLDIKVGERSRFTVGAIWWNWDAFATALQPRTDGTFERVRVRSNDFLPTLDFVLGF